MSANSWRSALISGSGWPRAGSGSGSGAEPKSGNVGRGSLVVEEEAGWWADGLCAEMAKMVGVAEKLVAGRDDGSGAGGREGGLDGGGVGCWR